MFLSSRRQRLFTGVAGLLLAGVAAASESTTIAAELSEAKPGSRVLVDKAGEGRRGIVLRVEDNRYFVVYEGEDEKFDEWVDPASVHIIPPRMQTPFVAAPQLKEAPEPEVTRTPPSEVEVSLEALALSKTLVFPRPEPGAITVSSWLEPIPRDDVSAPLDFNEAKLVQPYFRRPDRGGIPSARIPTKVTLLPAQVAASVGFAALEGSDVAIYRADREGGFSRVGQLDTAIFGAHALSQLHSADLNSDNNPDLIVVGGPIAQIYFGTSDGRFVASEQPYRSKEPLGHVAVGKFFVGANPQGVAVVEGDNAFRLLTVTSAGLVPQGTPFTVKFDRIVHLVAGDFDGDSYSDIAIATETRNRPTGTWIFFNQNSTQEAFLWPTGSRDDFVRALYVADLDRDGRDDLIMTDNDGDRGERVRIAYGSAGRSGLEDKWELLGTELGVGFGTGSVVVADFNRDGRLDLGIGGRNGLRIHLGADYRRISRNPTWPLMSDHTGLPEQRSFVTADLNGDGAVDLIGYTPAFATGYNVTLNATAADVPGAFVPAPLKRRAPTQASSTTTRVQTALPTQEGAPTLQFLASRAEPYGPHRYRIVIELAAIDDGVVQAITAHCRYDAGRIDLVGVRQNDQRWSVEAVLPRGRNFEFVITARDDAEQISEPLRVTVNP